MLSRIDYTCPLFTQRSETPGGDGAESRLLLEQEWAARLTAHEREKKAGKARTYSQTVTNLSRLAQAMVAIDLDRALAMAAETAQFDDVYSDVRTLILKYVLATESQRKTMSMEQYGGGDEDE